MILTVYRDSILAVTIASGAAVAAVGACEVEPDAGRCGVAGCRCLQGGCRAGSSCIDDVCVQTPGADGEADTGDGVDLGPELVRDGGFESWIDETSTVWTEGEATRRPSVDFPFAGSLSARVRSMGESCVGQALEVGIAIPEGQGCFAASAAVRHEAGLGGVSAPQLRLDAVDDDGGRGAANLELSWAEGGAWRASQGVMVLPFAVHALTVSVCGQGAGELDFSLDAVSVRQVEC